MNRREFIKKSTQISAGMAVSAMAGCYPKKSETRGEFDIVIKNGTIYDGTLNPPYNADIGIKGERIHKIGTIDGTPEKTINASGKIITPGFIDVHTHCDAVFKRIGMKRFLAYLMPGFKGNHNYLYQGVTTVMTGLCGYGYSDIEKWFDILDSLTFGTNVCHLAPHGMIRKQLFGDRQPSELTGKQLNQLKYCIAEQMEKGVFGVSTGLEYSPGLHASEKELIEISKVVGKSGGSYVTHIRDLSGGEPRYGKPGILNALKEAVSVCQRAEVPVQISHLLLKKPWNGVRSDEILEIIEKARSEGLPVNVDQTPYASGASVLAARVPNQFKSDSGILDTYKSEAGREKIRKEMEYRFAEVSGPENIMISGYPENKSYEGRTIQEIAVGTGKSPAEIFVDLACSETSPTGIFFEYDKNVLHNVMQKDYVITISDGWTIPKGFTKPHPLTYGAFPHKLLQYGVVEPERLSSVIRSMTSLPADVFNIRKRGRIETGYFADIAVIDLVNLKVKSTFKRPHQYSEGIDHLFINGTHSIRNGEATGLRNGKPLRRS